MLKRTQIPHSKLVNKKFTFLAFLSISLLFSACSQQEKTPQNLLKLWYNAPATQWEEALPLGNGRMGAMVFGNSATEHIQLNEETIWAGEPGNNLPRGFKKVLPQIRQLLFEGKYKEAEALTMTVVPRHAPEWNNYGMPYQTLGDVYIEFPGHENVEEYYRELDIQNAISSTTYKKDGVEYKREYFISAPDEVMLIRLTANKPGKISCTVNIETPHTHFEKTISNGELMLTGTSESLDNKEGKVKFTTLIHPILSGGKMIANNDKISIENADTVTLFISIGTNFKNYKDLSGDASKMATAFLKPAIEKPYNTLKTAHITDYRNFFDRVELDLGLTDSIYNPTDIRVKDFNDGYDPQMVSLYFQFGRYLLISASRPGTQPANLQGIWNHKLKPAWDSKYTVNINTEMNYWPAEVTNLPEMHEPLFSMLDDLAEVGQQTAKEMYGARGWAMHHNTDIWRLTGPIDGAFYGMWPMGGAWLSQHLWQHYLFGGDTEFLKKAYPILKGIATFYVDVLQEEPTNGWMVVTPSMSPENRHPGGTSMAAGNTMDNQLIFDVFSNAIKASKTLHIDQSFADSVETLLKKLPPMQIGQHNQLQEWLQDWDRTNDHHRHVSHLYGLYPSNQISPFSNPALFEAAKNSLIYRGDKSTGWSMGWKVNLWARLLDGNRAYKLIKDQLNPAPIQKKGQHGGTYPNLFDAHPPFQIDGNFGCTSGIAEMLVQSHDGDIYLLPALPDEWKNGSVKGLRVRGGFTIDLKWTNSKVEQVVVHSNVGGNCRIRVANALQGETEVTEVSNTLNTNPLFAVASIKTPLISDKAQVMEISLPKTMVFEFQSEENTSYTFTSVD